MHAHSILVGAARQRDLFARQISLRGGKLYCENRGDRVGIGGDAVTYSEGKIHLTNNA